MNSEAMAILDAFREKGVRSGSVVLYTDFGDAIIWEGGHIRDASVGDALSMLVAEDYVEEFDAGLALTMKGEREIYDVGLMPDHCARVYLMGGILVVKQASLRGVPAEYVIDENRVRRLDLGDEVGIAEAVKAAVAGCL